MHPQLATFTFTPGELSTPEMQTVTYTAPANKPPAELSPIDLALEQIATISMSEQGYPLRTWETRETRFNNLTDTYTLIGKYGEVATVHASEEKLNKAYEIALGEHTPDAAERKQISLTVVPYPAPLTEVNYGELQTYEPPDYLYRPG